MIWLKDIICLSFSFKILMVWLKDNLCLYLLKYLSRAGGQAVQTDKTVYRLSSRNLGTTQEDNNVVMTK
jgi:hypothetical protein